MSVCAQSRQGLVRRGSAWVRKERLQIPKDYGPIWGRGVGRPRDLGLRPRGATERGRTPWRNLDLACPFDLTNSVEDEKIWCRRTRAGGKEGARRRGQEACMIGPPGTASRDNKGGKGETLSGTILW